MIEKVRIKPINPMYAYRWYKEFGETRQIVRRAGKNYALDTNGKLISNAEFAVKTGDYFTPIHDGDWVIYEKTAETDNIRVMNDKQFQDTFKTYTEFE